MRESILVLTDERMLNHVAGAGHPERADRLSAILRRLEREPLDGLEWAVPRPATVDQVRRVHSVAHVDRVNVMRGLAGQLDPDTGVSHGSVEAAYLAAGASIEAVEALATGRFKRAFALVRPPGHHAERDRSMGFCLFNNIAVAAEHARAVLGFERIMIVDWDVHHCNGTQSSFYDRDDVLVISSHRSPFYPGTGALGETGTGVGEGYTVNMPLPPGLADEVICNLYRALLPAIADEYAPDLVLVSAGFDAHSHDPLGGLRMTEAGFASICGIVRDIADRHAGGKLALFLEGGYDLDALASSTRACMEVMTGAPSPTIDVRTDIQGDQLVKQIAAAHSKYWPIQS